jgi:hypothetical protein
MFSYLSTDFEKSFNLPYSDPDDGENSPGEKAPPSSQEQGKFIE